MPLFRCGTPSILLGAIDLDCLYLARHKPHSPLATHAESRADLLSVPHSALPHFGF
jgi:hypothetical protein